MRLFRRTKKKKAPDYIAVNSDKKYEFRFTADSEEIDINNTKYQIEIVNGADGFDYIIFQNRKYPFEILEKKQNKYEILINGVAYSISVETPFSFKRKKFLAKQKKQTKNEKFLAPMPGKIVDVMAEVGSELKEGDSVLILEAMKMQNELLADFSGKIVNINVKPGDVVMKDDVLMEIERK